MDYVVRQQNRIRWRLVRRIRSRITARRRLDSAATLAAKLVDGRVLIDDRFYSRLPKRQSFIGLYVEVLLDLDVLNPQVDIATQATRLTTMRHLTGEGDEWRLVDRARRVGIARAPGRGIVWGPFQPRCAGRRK